MPRGAPKESEVEQRARVQFVREFSHAGRVIAEPCSPDPLPEFRHTGCLIPQIADRNAPQFFQHLLADFGWARERDLSAAFVESIEIEQVLEHSLDTKDLTQQVQSRGPPPSTLSSSLTNAACSPTRVSQVASSPAGSVPGTKSTMASAASTTSGPFSAGRMASSPRRACLNTNSASSESIKGPLSLTECIATRMRASILARPACCSPSASRRTASALRRSLAWRYR